MKDKLVRTPFDQDAFDDKVYDHYLGYQGELQICTDKKSEIFIQVNYFHSVLDDAMEYLLKTKHARNSMKPQQIIKILFDKGVLEEKEAKDAIKINKIRNFFTHGYDTPSIIPNAKEIIEKMEIEFTDFPPMIGHTTVSVKELMENTVAKWGMYQKLDFIIHDLVMDIENKILYVDIKK
jgi:hypothetical protein